MLLNAIRETASGKPSRPYVDLDKVRLLEDLSASPATPSARNPAVASSELHEVEQMLRDLKASAYASAQQPTSRVSFPEVPLSPLAAAVASPVSALRAEAELARRQLEKDNREIRAELIAARRILQERMGGRV
jgi:hypothetical protein